MLINANEQNLMLFNATTALCLPRTLTSIDINIYRFFQSDLTRMKYCAKNSPTLCPATEYGRIYSTRERPIENTRDKNSWGITTPLSLSHGYVYSMESSERKKKYPGIVNEMAVVLV
jgi:hypothetical protein